MDTPKKNSFKILAARKLKKILVNPIQILDLPKLLLIYIREFLHQRRFIDDYRSTLKGTHSSRRINSIIRKRNLKNLKYLEIGIAHGYTFEAVRTDYKIGVDPFPKSRIKKQTSRMKIDNRNSDDFFASNSQSFDFIFVDGMHTFEQSYTDLINSLNSITSRGVVLVDDVIPGDKYSAMPDIALCNKERMKDGEELETWSGDVFKSIIMLKDLHPNIEIRTIISPNHPQSLVWISPKHKEIFDLQKDLEFLKEYTSIDYEDFFKDLFEVNKFFNLSMEWQAINNYIKDIEAH